MGGAYPAARTPFPAGEVFRWFGTPLRLDGARAALLLGSAEGAAELRAHLPRTIRKLQRGRGASVLPLRQVEPADDPGALVLGKGSCHWSAQVITTPGRETLLVFGDGIPPANTDLRITQAPTPHETAARRKPICFAAGTPIDTPTGPRRVEDLRPGDRVVTRDDGPQEILWTGLRKISGARMFALPGLRPVRLRAGAIGNDDDLILSQGHQVLLGGDKIRTLWSVPEVLVRAGDLIDGGAVAVDHGAREVAYVHLLLRRHSLLRAAGGWCESFHPGDADLAQLGPADFADLLDLVPSADVDPEAYGPHARRCLTAAELAILRHEGAPRYLA